MSDYMNLRDILIEAGMNPPKYSDMDVIGISTYNSAKPNEISIAFRYCDVATSKSDIVLADMNLTARKKLLIMPLNSVYESAVAIARVFIKHGIYPDYNVKGKFHINDDLIRFGENYTIGEGTTIGSFTEIGNNVRIGANTVIESNVYIGADSVIGDNVIIRAGARIASTPFNFYGKVAYNDYPGIGRVFIDNNVVIGTNTVIQRGTFSDTTIASETAIGDMVVIGHDVHIGHNCLIVSATGISGYVNIEDNVKIYGQCGVNNFTTIHKNAVVMGKSSVIKDVPAGQIISGDFGREHKKELNFQAKLRKITKEM